MQCPASIMEPTWGIQPSQNEPCVEILGIGSRRVLQYRAEQNSCFGLMRNQSKLGQAEANLTF